jgi:hypothetical protein
MRKNHTALSAAALAILTVTLSACSFSMKTTKTTSTDPAPTETAAPVTTVADAPSDQTAPSPEPVTGDVLAPGQATTAAGNLPFVNYDDKTAVFSHKVVSVTTASAEQRATLVKEEPMFENYDIYFVNVESRYVSGAGLEYASFSNGFRPVTAEKKEVQNVALIGYDFCDQDSIPSPGNDSSTVIRTCIAAVVPNGAPAPKGVAWMQYDTKYDWYDGKPAYLMLG